MNIPAVADENLRRLADQYGVETADLGQLRVPGEILRLVPREMAMRHTCFPLDLAGRTLRVAVADPLNTEGPDSLSQLHQLNIELLLAPKEQILMAINRFYGSQNLITGLVPEGAAPIFQSPEAADNPEDAPIIRLVYEIIEEGVRRGASDIHVEPLARTLRVRFRVDGVLTEGKSPPQRLQLAIISRLKIMANISIAEKRLPQDGRIQLRMEGRSLDLRVSVLPTAHGESIVMRILDQENLRLGLTELGFHAEDQRQFERLMKLPDGIFLVTGPTGSGKTTTLYSCLHHLNQSDRKIITVEDPVEYQMSGINQVPVRSEVGMTFASALRAMLRQSPNIIMVGEIRDAETAEIAINASLTGHMVFSTLHTNDAPSAVTRLVDIGVKPFLVSTSLRGVMAQRLVRTNCRQCSRPHQPTAQELQMLNITPRITAGANFMKGAGCGACHGTGYRGRMGIFEILVMSDALRAMVHAGASAARLRAQARAEGIRTLREDGVRKIIAGLTTVEEVASITAGDVS